MKGIREQPLPSRADVMRRMEQRLAYEHCHAVLRAFCHYTEFEQKSCLFALSGNDPVDEVDAALLAEAVAYLDWRGLLERRADFPSMATVLPEEGSG